MLNRGWIERAIDRQAMAKSLKNRKLNCENKIKLNAMLHCRDVLFHEEVHGPATAYSAWKMQHEFTPLLESELRHLFSHLPKWKHVELTEQTQESRRLLREAQGANFKIPSYTDWNFDDLETDTEEEYLTGRVEAYNC
eukprot:TRINITY_DN16921_c0_g1_i2.p1 TRINITY_DN16921_c0_g1~~TRINITY_DN16921_c0_g1_i2.p1  ORF type:complete len:155 (+),score=27.71 TRINITY_DN16921_c0_g1_i2:54-467(+)